VIRVSGEDGDFPYGDWTAPDRTPAGPAEIIAAHGGSFRSAAWPSRPGPILSGSSTLTSTLLEQGLADEFLPVLLGTGKRFFAEGTPPRSFELSTTANAVSFYKTARSLKTEYLTTRHRQ
jgi:hypothetical protein